MARINIEDSIHTDRRWFDLLIKSGDIDKAYGILVRTWIVAQKWYLSPEKMIPVSEWNKQLISEIVIETGWAERVGDFVRVCGAEQQFAWLDQRVEAGRKGGAAQRGVKLPIQEAAKREGARVILNKATKTGKITKPTACTDCGAASNDIHGHHSDYSKPLDVIWLCRSCHNKTHAFLEAGAKRPLAGAKPSSSCSLSVSLSSSRSSSISEENKSSEGVAPRSAGGASIPTWEAYREAYAKRYGEPPVRNASVNAQLSQLVKRLGATEAPDVAQFYLTHNDQFYLKSMHSVGIMLRDAEKLRTEWATGNRMLSSKAREIERMQHNSNSWDEAARILNERRTRNEAV